MGEELKDLFGRPSCVCFISADKIMDMPKVKDSVELEETEYRGITPDAKVMLESYDVKLLNPDEHFLSECFDVRIETKDQIIKPKNLKYPNKKRAMRIWNKWRNRYGVNPGKTIVLKNCQISTE